MRLGGDPKGGAGATGEAPDSLAICIDLQRRHPPIGKVMVVNGGVEPLRIWIGGNSWGDGALTFQLEGFRIARLPQVYSRNVPAFMELGPDETFETPFDLGDGGWEPSVVEVSGRMLTAWFEIADSVEAREHHVWVGRIQSDPVQLL